MATREAQNLPISMVRWRKDGGAEIAAGSSLEYAFPEPITSTDEGVYEIYYQGERNEGRGALFRLIVRGKYSIFNIISDD